MSKVRICRFVALLSMLFIVTYVSAAYIIDPEYDLDSSLAAGACYYGYGTQELAEAQQTILVYVRCTVLILYAIASLLTVYSATSVYVKMVSGESGVTKSIVTMVGAMIFIVSTSFFMPGLFGYEATV